MAGSDHDKQHFHVSDVLLHSHSRANAHLGGQLRTSQRQGAVYKYQRKASIAWSGQPEKTVYAAQERHKNL
jgi:hypothetical protein